MNQDEVYHCLIMVFGMLPVSAVNDLLKWAYKTDIDFVLKSASPETVYGALHEWAKERDIPPEKG